MGLVTANDPALAQDTSLARAEEHFNKAQALYVSGKFEEAAIEFQAAYEARALPPFLFNIGASYEKLAKSAPAKWENWDLAIKYYNRYLKEQPKAKDRKKIGKRIKVLERERDRIKADVAKAEKPDEVKTSDAVKKLGDAKIRGLVVIESDPSAAFIYLDDKKKGPVSKTPWSGTIEGEHTVYIERKGYKPREMTISPSPDKLIVLSFALAEEDYLGWVDITSNVPGADIYIDDKSVGVYRRTPFSGNLKPGKHKIWITAEGYNEFSTTVEIVAGETHSVNAKLKGAPVGYLNVRGPGISRATVHMDGKVLCKRGPCRRAVRQGKHIIKVKRKGYKTFKRTIYVEAKTEIALSVKLNKRPGRGDAVWAFIFGGIFAGGGAYLGYQAQGIHDELNEEISIGNPPPDSSDPRFRRGKLFTIGADVAYGLAGVTLLTAIYYSFRDKGPASKGSLDIRAVAVEPQVGPGYAGLGMEVNW